MIGRCILSMRGKNKKEGAKPPLKHPQSVASPSPPPLLNGMLAFPESFRGSASEGGRVGRKTHVKKGWG
jgi:hypothetical protein